MTPHAITVCDGDGKTVKVYPKGENLIRLSVKTVPADFLPDGTPTTVTEFGQPEGLPEYQRGTFYIVSQLVKNALPLRTDLLVPAEVVRDEAGNIIGCKSLGR
jgi:hypothetical protein